MKTISQNISVKFQPLPDEQVLWEGGPARNGFWHLLVQEFTRLGSILFVFWLLGSLLYLSHGIGKETELNDKKTSIEATESVEQTTDNQSEEISPKKYDSLLEALLSFKTIQKYISFCAGLLLVILITSLVFAMIRFKSFWYVITTERLIIQAGLFEKSITTIDLDKIISIKTSQGIFQRVLNLTSMEIIHPGINLITKHAFTMTFPNVLRFLDARENVASLLINQWLPRDNHSHS